MKINEIKRDIEITREQCRISAQKHKYWKEQNAPFKKKLYKIRQEALNRYAIYLEKKLKQHEGIQYKKANS